MIRIWSSFRLQFAAAVLLAWASVLVRTSPCRAQATGDAVVHTDWLRWVPGDVKLYVEMRDLAGIRRQFRRLGIWEAVRQLGPTEAATSQPWHLRAEQSLWLSPDDAIDQLLGLRAALFAAEPAKWQSGVVLAEVRDADDIRVLLRQWRGRATETDGPVQRYVLAGGIGLAVRGRTLLFGLTEDPEGLWERSAALLADRRGPTLGARSEFAALRRRVADEYSCLFFAAWSDTRAGGDEPRSNRVLAASTVGAEGIDCQIRGQVHAPTSQPAAWEPAALAQLSTDAAVIWARSFDESALRQWLAVDAEAESSLVAVFMTAFLADRSQREQFARDLGPRVALIIHNMPEAGQAAPAVPAMSVACEVRNPERIINRLDGSLDMFTAFVYAAAQEPIPPEGTFVRRQRAGSADLHWAPWGGTLSKRFSINSYLSINPCWTVLDGRLVLSSSLNEVMRLVDVAGGTPPTPGALKRFEAASGEGPITEFLQVDGRRLAELVSSWDQYLALKRPDMLSADWWRRWAQQRLEERGRLGVGLKDAPDRGAAVVAAVEPASPAEGQLEAGDLIVSVGGRALATSRPAQEVAEAYRVAQDSDTFDLRVRRGGKELDVHIPRRRLPSFPANFDPIATLRRLAALARRVERFTAVGRSAGDRVDMGVQIRWVGSAAAKDGG